MTDETRTTEPLDLDGLSRSTLEWAVGKTIVALCSAGELDATDTGTARLALEIAARIDADELDCGVSLYARLYDALAELRHEGAIASRRLAAAILADSPTRASAGDRVEHTQRE